jgi:DNA-directed RNA polymerase subunit RPC12/RpoP
MAKIIKNGDKTYKCSTCGCEYIIESKDVRVGYDDDNSLTSLICGGVACRYVLCPQCGTRKVIEWL